MDEKRGNAAEKVKAVIDSYRCPHAVVVARLAALLGALGQMERAVPVFFEVVKETREIFGDNIADELRDDLDAVLRDVILDGMDDIPETSEDFVAALRKRLRQIAPTAEVTEIGANSVIQEAPMSLSKQLGHTDCPCPACTEARERRIREKGDPN